MSINKHVAKIHFLDGEMKVLNKCLLKKNFKIDRIYKNGKELINSDVMTSHKISFRYLFQT